MVFFSLYMYTFFSSFISASVNLTFSLIFSLSLPFFFLVCLHYFLFLSPSLSFGLCFPSLSFCILVFSIFFFLPHCTLSLFLYLWVIFLSVRLLSFCILSYSLSDIFLLSSYSLFSSFKPLWSLGCGGVVVVVEKVVFLKRVRRFGRLPLIRYGLMIVLRLAFVSIHNLLVSSSNYMGIWMYSWSGL